MPGPPVLCVDNLSVAFEGRPVVAEISFAIQPAMIVGLFGESGCGKTTLAMSLLRLLPPGRYRLEGSVKLGGRDLLGMRESELQRIRGGRMSLILQDPLLALNPVMRVSDQVKEVLSAHHKPATEMSRLFELVGLPPGRHNAYPHHLSGGERQRVLLAQALACRPSIVIADEPFSALDPSRVLQLAGLFRDLTRELGTSFLLISHSPGVLARIADELLVMYAGRIVERGRPAELLAAPLHPYTSGLLRSLQPQPDGRLYSIPGNPPALADRARGCPFEPRCEERLSMCIDRMPAEEERGEERSVRCFKYAS